MTKSELTSVVRGLVPILRAYGAHISARLAAVEAKERGIDGAAGAPGPRGVDGPPGPPGRDGRDGLAGLPGEKGADGINGRAGVDGQAGRDGVDGQAGRDGLGFEDLTVVHDGGRGIVIRFTRGDQVKDFAITIPALLYRGVYAPGTAYEKGDVVTWAGSAWIAQDATTAKPGEAGTASRAWVLAVKAGRDGKAGIKGEPGPAGADGRPGRDR